MKGDGLAVIAIAGFGDRAQRHKEFFLVFDPDDGLAFFSMDTIDGADECSFSGLGVRVTAKVFGNRRR